MKHDGEGVEEQIAAWVEIRARNWKLSELIEKKYIEGELEEFAQKS